MDLKRGLLLSGAIIGVCGFGGGAWAADAQAGAAAAASNDSNTVGDVVVVAERKSENLQQTPLAVSALSPQDLKAQRIDTGANLASTVPNMSFQPGLYGKPDFSIRGIGYQLVTTAGDAGVAVHENDAPVSSGRVAQADFFDVNQVEVLRGPQGTLYGRNATGGVINIITAKPVDKFTAAITAEAGNYATYKGNGFINIPLGDMFAVRVAGDFSKHDGYQYNEFNGTRTDAQNIWSTRATVSFTPNDKFHAYFMYEHFAEDDSGGGNGGVATNSCTTDAGPSSIGGVAVTNAAVRNYLSFGCQLTPNIYGAGTRGGILNGVGTFGNRLAVENGLAAGSLFANNVRPTGAYDVNIDVNPTNLTRNDLAQFSAEWNVTDNLKLSSLTTYDRDTSLYGAGGLRAATPFNFGISIADPQIAGGQALSNYTSGTFDRLYSEEYSEEVRLASSFSGPVNFSVGAFYLHTHKNDDVFVFDNFNSFLADPLELTPDPRPRETATGGHEYFESLNPYTLNSKAIFGEVYWNVTSDLKLTGGFRYTSDHKEFFANNSANNLLCGPKTLPTPCPASGIAFGAPQNLTFNEPTGRVNLDWTPKLSFTDATLVYASYSHGYKGGGFNPPNLIDIPPYKPEFVDAIELGTKNTLLNHTLTLNLTGFYYDYKNYQFSQADVFGTITNNVNARIWGLEFESQWRPVGALALNAQVGYLNTRIKAAGANSESINQYDPTGGHTDTLIAVKNLTGECVFNKAAFGNLINDIQTGANGRTIADITNIACTGALVADYGLAAGVPLGADGLTPQTGGVAESFAGKRLPNTPDWTAAIGAQYALHINDSWRLTPRVDLRYTGGQYSDLFNTPGLYVKPYASVNVTVTLANLDNGFSAQAFAKNIGTQGTIIGAVPGGGAITGSENTIIIADPTTYGISLSKRF